MIRRGLSPTLWDLGNLGTTFLLAAFCIFRAVH